MSDEVKQHEKPLTLRERMAVQILLLMFKVIKSTDFYGDEYIKKIKELAELV